MYVQLCPLFLNSVNGPKLLYINTLNKIQCLSDIVTVNDIVDC